MEMKYLNSAVTLFFRLNLIGSCLRLSNEISCILVAQGAAKLPEVKVGGLRKKMKNARTSIVKCPV